MTVLSAGALEFADLGGTAVSAAEVGGISEEDSVAAGADSGAEVGVPELASVLVQSQSSIVIVVASVTV